MLKDYTGLDGCKWVIELAKGERLEPVNLGDFKINLVDGNKVVVSYHEETDRGSICMVGKIVTIDCIEE